MALDDPGGGPTRGQEVGAGVSFVHAPGRAQGGGVGIAGAQPGAPAAVQLRRGLRGQAVEPPRIQHQRVLVADLQDGDRGVVAIGQPGVRIHVGQQQARVVLQALDHVRHELVDALAVLREVFGRARIAAADVQVEVDPDALGLERRDEGIQPGQCARVQPDAHRIIRAGQQRELRGVAVPLVVEKMQAHHVAAQAGHTAGEGRRLGGVRETGAAGQISTEQPDRAARPVEQGLALRAQPAGAAGGLLVQRGQVERRRVGGDQRKREGEPIRRLRPQQRSGKQGREKQGEAGRHARL
jgi:hypothetical protein